VRFLRLRLIRKLVERFRSRASRWWLIAGVWATVVVCGIGGFIQQANEQGVPVKATSVVYNTLDLIALSYLGGEPLNWRIEVARFMAPIIAAASILQAASAAFQEQLRRFRVRFLHGHVVVVGLGDVGSRLVPGFLASGRRVVAIDPDASGRGVAQARSRGVHVEIGDPTQPDVLDRAGVGRAAELVVVTGDDGTSVEVVAAAGTLGREEGAPALRCAVEVARIELARLLRSFGLRRDGKLRIEFFDLDDLAAQAWVAEHPPIGDGTRRPHFVVVGAGEVGRSLMVTTAQRHHSGGGEPMLLTLIDREASDRWDGLLTRHPALLEAVEATIVDVDLENPSTAALDLVGDRLRDHLPTGVAVTFSEEGLALATALWIHEVIDDPTVPIVVRTKGDQGMSALLHPENASGRFDGLDVFPYLERAANPDAVLGGVREQLARSLHADYLDHVGPDDDGFQRPWALLDDDERESTRRQAEQLVNNLADAGYDLVPLRQWGSSIAIEPADVERLARDEHHRWKQEREAQGWTYGERRDDTARTNPMLVDFESLDAESQESNRKTIRAIPALLARAGLELETRNRV
jgi:hypothetical protein